jgi:ABC-type transport system substrate-binding protein/class 3 adenylate cyclase/streptogramin lyase
VLSDTSSEASAPRGANIRTFLFADVRGYTRYTHEHGDEAASALASRFADIVREAVPAFEGELLELRGDEALCVFTSARQALRAAVELQRWFRKQVGGEPVLPLGVGMGLDAGEAVPTQGGYRGGALNVAARLCALAAPGQVLATETVAGLARRVEGLRFQPRRSVRVKGVAEPVRLVKVVSEVPLPPVPELPRSASAHWTGRRVVSAIVAVFVVVVGVIATLVAGRGGPGGVVTVHRDSLVFLTENGHARVVASVGAAPSGVAVGGGRVWVSNRDDGTVTGVPVDGGAPETIQVGAGTAPTGIAYYRGAVWVAASGSGTVDRLNPVEGGRVADRIRTGDGPQGVAVAAGKVWVTNSLDATVAEIDPRRNTVLGEISAGPDPTAIVAAGGDVWIANTTSDTVSRINAGSGKPVPPVAVQDGPDALAVRRKTVWVANGLSHSVSRISVKGASPGVETVPAGLEPSAISVVADRVWVGDSRGALVGLDPSTPARRTRAALAGVPLALASTSEGVWAAVGPPLIGHQGGTLRAVEGSSFADPLDPAIAFSFPDEGVSQLTYDGLTGFRRVSGEQGLTVVPDLATAIPQPSDGGRTYTFEVRPGIRYSNGRLVRPSDFRWALERVFDAGIGSAYYDAVVGASACQRRPPPGGCHLRQGITTDDSAGTVTFHLARPDGDFPTKLALSFAAAVPESVPAPPHCDYSRTQTCGYRRQPHPVPGTGPYMILPGKLGFQTPGKLELVRNPYFRQWSADAQPTGYPNRIVFHFGGTPGKEAAEVEQGAADWSFDPPPPNVIARLLTTAPGQVHKNPLLGIEALALNTRRPPFNRMRAREAFNDAIDRSATAGADKSTCQILPPGMPGYVPYCPYTEHIAGAREGVWVAPNWSQAHQLVKASGTSGDRVTVWLNARGINAPGSTPAQVTTFGDAIVKALSKLRYDAHLQLISANKAPGPAAQVGIVYWFEDYPAPSDFLQLLLSCDAPEATYPMPTVFCSRSLDRRMARALHEETVDPTRAATEWARIDKGMTLAAPWVPLSTSTFTDIISKRVGNYQYNPQLGPILDQLWVK